MVAVPVVDAGLSPDGVLRAAWGSALGQVGHSLASEGNPEGPMSFARSGDELLVLDQVNRRIVRYDKSGRPIGTFETTATTQDIVVAKDGSVVTLDRLVDKRVRILDRGGRARAELALPADMKEETGLITGVFTDDKTVYVERSHGALVGVGTLDGQPLPREDGPHRTPQQSGNLLVSAALVQNRLTVNAFNRSHEQAPLHPRDPVQDRARGGARGHGREGRRLRRREREENVNVACLDPGDGHVLGRLTLEISMVPEETYKAWSVADDGTITSSFMTEDGAEYRTARCP